MGISRLKRLRDTIASLNAEVEAVKALRELKELMEDMNREQLLEGTQPNGSKISPEYALEDYARFKNLITPNPKRDLFTPNLKLEGDFHESITVEFLSNSVVFKSNDPKADKLFTKYGSLLGLSSENKAEIIIELRSEIIVSLKQTIRNSLL